MKHNMDGNNMEVVAIMSYGVLVRHTDNRTSIILHSSIHPDHPVIQDAMSYRLGYIAGLAAAVNDDD